MELMVTAGVVAFVLGLLLPNSRGLGVFLAVVSVSAATVAGYHRFFVPNEGSFLPNFQWYYADTVYLTFFTFFLCLSVSFWCKSLQSSSKGVRS